MVGEAERMARASEYVLGRMRPAERERAERDLETDAEFRFAVMSVAERMRRFGGTDEEEAWRGIAQRLEALPHMRGAAKPREDIEADRLAFPEEDDVEGGLSVFLRALRARIKRLFRFSDGSLSRTRIVAVLHDETHEVAAIVEVRSGGALRLLLLKDPGLAGNEQLVLWGLSEEGTYRWLSDIAGSAEIVLSSITGVDRHVGFALSRERLSPIPTGHMGGPPYANGLARPLAQAQGVSPRDPRHSRPGQVVTLKR